MQHTEYGGSRQILASFYGCLGDARNRQLELCTGLAGGFGGTKDRGESGTCKQGRVRAVAQHSAAQGESRKIQKKIGADLLGA